jgi:chromosome segregation ATPase
MSKIAIAENLERLAVQYQAVIDAAAVLKEIGKLDQVKAEAEKAAAAARAEAEDAKADAKKAKDAVAKSKEQAAEMVAKANDQALATLQEAEQKAAAMLASAETQVKAQVESMADKVEAKKAAIAGQVAQLTTVKVELESSLAGLSVAYDQKLAEVEAVEARLAKAQAQIAKLLG